HADGEPANHQIGQPERSACIGGCRPGRIPASRIAMLAPVSGRPVSRSEMCPVSAKVVGRGGDGGAVGPDESLQASVHAHSAMHAALGNLICIRLTRAGLDSVPARAPDASSSRSRGRRRFGDSSIPVTSEPAYWTRLPRFIMSFVNAFAV